MDQLKKCPFCGSAATIAHFLEENAHAVFCPGCFIMTILYETEEGAVAVWNRRTK